MPKWKLVYIRGKRKYKEVKVGDRVKLHNDKNIWYVKGFEEPHKPSAGFVYVTKQVPGSIGWGSYDEELSRYYVSVIGAEWIKHAY